MDIIFQNKDWLVINKPTGISSQAAFAGDIAIPDWLSLHKNETVHVFSRLDKGTSGVMIMARNSKAATRAQEILKLEKSKKIYAFLSASDSLTSKRGKSWEVATAISGKPAQTQFERIGPCGKYFLYHAHIKSGRIHQIRRHAKESRVPILGDDKYGGATFPRLCLHCKSLFWPEIEQDLQAPMPSSMGSLGDFANDPGFLVAFDRRLQFYLGITDVFRCVHRGEMAALDCAIDFFAGYFCLWVYDEVIPLSEIEDRLAPYFKKLFSRYGAQGVVIKRNLKNPHSRGLIQEQKILGSTPPELFDVQEHGLKYRVSLTQGQHTGFFIDQRDNRLRVRQRALGRDVANLFSYTCSFSIAAAAGHAHSIISVDAARPCLETGKLGFAANGLINPDRNKFIKEDVRLWLKRQSQQNDMKNNANKFNLIICDPPTFSSTKAGGRFSVTKEWESLAKMCKKISAPNCELLFCTNHQEGHKDYYLNILKEVFANVTHVPAPIDFPVIKENQEHVKMFWCSIK